MKVTKVIPPIVFVNLIIFINLTSSAESVQRRKSNKYRRGIGPSNVTQATGEVRDEISTKLPELDESASPVEDDFTKNKSKRKKESSEVISIEQTEQVLSSWASIESYTGGYMKHMIEQKVQPILEDLFVKTDVTIGCESAIRTVLKDAVRMQKYAVQSK